VPAEIDADGIGLAGGGLEPADHASRRRRPRISCEPQPSYPDEYRRDDGRGRARPDSAGSGSDDLERLVR
jgi:hypothetical protein